MKTMILIATLLVLAVAFIIITSLNHAVPVAEPIQIGSKTSKQTLVAELKPEISIDAENLSRELIKDFAATAKKYKGKAVEITGEVANIVAYDESRTIHVLLKGAKAQATDRDFEHITIVLLPQYSAMGAMLSTSQKVKVVGKANDAGNALFYAFVDCSLTEITKSDVVAVSAADLAKEFTQNAGEAARKYDGKELMLSGTVRAVAGDGPYPTELEGDGKTVIATANRNLKVGQIVRMRGQCTWHASEGKVTLSKTNVIRIREQ